MNTLNPAVSRIDICFDFFSNEFSFDDVSDKDWIAQSKEINSYLIHGQRSGFKFGKKGIVCRIYDKTREIETQSKKFYLYDLWKEHGWDGESIVWRVEFEFQTQILKSFQFRSIAKAVNNQELLWALGTEDWLKLVIPTPNDSNRSRWSVHPVWEEIRQATAHGSPIPVKEVSKASLPSDETLFVNGLGYFISFMASRRIKNVDLAMKAYIREADYFYEEQGRLFKSIVAEKLKERAKRFNIPMEMFDDE